MELHSYTPPRNRAANSPVMKTASLIGRYKINLHCNYRYYIYTVNNERVKKEKFSKINLTKTEVNIMVIVGTILISVGASILFVLKVNSVKDI